MEATYTGQDDEREVVSLGRTWLVKNGERPSTCPPTSLPASTVRTAGP
jgi:hypothetical protein